MFGANQLDDADGRETVAEQEWIKWRLIETTAQGDLGYKSASVHPDVLRRLLALKKISVIKSSAENAENPKVGEIFPFANVTVKKDPLGDFFNPANTN